MRKRFIDTTANPRTAVDQGSIKIEQHRRDSHCPILTHGISSKTQTGPDRSRSPLQNFRLGNEHRIDR